jgi:hypothetical protein
VVEHQWDTFDTFWTFLSILKWFGICFVALCVLGPVMWIINKAKDHGPGLKQSEVRRHEQDQNMAEALRRPHEDERKQQLDALKAAVPSTPPERMRATIHVNRLNVLAAVRKLDGRGSMEHLENHAYAVDMILQLSEADRALILERQLEQVVMEKAPKYRNDQILNILAEFDQRYRTYDATTQNGAFQRAMMDKERRSFASYAAETRDITLADYMKAPYTRAFETMPEASDYSEKLKTELLPRVRAMLDKNIGRKAAESVEF